MSGQAAARGLPGSSRAPVPPAPIGQRPYRVVFVCTGNICRSPMAEVITRALAATAALGDGTPLGQHLDVRSAGTGPWHEGEPMDRAGGCLPGPGRVPRPPPRGAPILAV